MTHRQQQEQTLLSRLSEVQELSLSEAMHLLEISESTARRLFVTLEQQGKALRVHGGIRLLNPVMTLYSFEQGVQHNREKKLAIAREACRQLEDGDVVFLDSGTTMQCFCGELANYLTSHPLNLTLYTNSLANLELLSPLLPVILIGGEYRENRKDFCGYLAEQSLSALYFNKCFVGADGCIHGREFVTTDFECARINQLAVHHAQKSILLMDSSKFGIFAHVSYVSLKEIQTLITDEGIPEETLASMTHAGAHILTARL